MESVISMAHLEKEKTMTMNGVKPLKSLFRQVSEWQLIVVAALAMGMASCSNNDNIIDIPSTTATPPKFSTFYVTVEAGIDDTYESEVGSDKQRTLYFTKGDSLFVSAAIAGYTGFFLAGTLSIDASTISDDGKSARFTGDLSVYYDNHGTVIPTTHPFFSDPSDPLAECSSATANLIPKGAPAGLYKISNYIHYVHDYRKSIAADVNKLMRTALCIQGDLDPTTHCFTLRSGDAILNCNLGGLAPGCRYQVEVDNGNSKTTYSTKYIADADGKVSFAVSNEGGSKDWTVKLTGVAYRYSYPLGTKDLSAKVYNVTRATATSFEYLEIETAKINNQAGSLDYILKTFELNESTWSRQNGYGLLKFKYTLSSSPGMGIMLAPISTLTIDTSAGHKYTITDTRDNGYGGTLGFDSNFQFYVGIRPFYNQALTITYDPHNNEYVYTYDTVGTTLNAGKVLDLGTIELVREDVAN
jgi:hypothetical protein